MQFPKLKRTENRILLSAVKLEPCMICGLKPCDPCHIKSRGAGGPDERWNLVAMCRKHHTLQHTIGWTQMWNENTIVRMKLTGMGWKMNGQFLWHPNLETSSSR